MSQTVIVTGVSSGVGAATAKLFNDRGNLVFGLARSATSRKDLAEQGIILIDTDLSQEDSVLNAVAKIRQQTNQIDVVAYVAGMALNGAIEDLKLDAAEQQFQVNVFGVARLIQAILPVMRQQKMGRIVVVTSSTAWFPMPLMGWYTASKRAIEGVLDTLRLEVAPFDIKVSMIEPGGIDTPMTQVEPNFIKTSGHGAYHDLVAKMTKIMAQQAKNMDSPSTIAKAIVEAATVKNPKIHYRIGRGISALIIAARILPTSWLDNIKKVMLRRVN